MSHILFFGWSGLEEVNYNRSKASPSRFSLKNKEKFVEPLCLKNKSLRVSLDSIQTPEEG